MRFFFILALIIALSAAKRSNAEADTTTYTCPTSGEVKFEWRAPSTANVGGKWVPDTTYTGHFHPDITFKSISHKNKLPNGYKTEHTYIYCEYTLTAAGKPQSITLHYNTRYDLRKMNCLVESSSVTCR